MQSSSFSTLSIMGYNISTSKQDISRHFVEFFKFPYRCLKTKYLSDGKDYIIEYNKVMMQRLAIYYYQMMKDDFLDPKHIFIFTTPQHHYPWSPKEIKDHTSFHGSFIQLTGSVVLESTSLPFPVTDCIDYEEESIYKSKDECIKICVHERHANNKTESFRELLHYTPFQPIKLLKDDPGFEKLYLECSKHCPTGCKLHQYEWKQSGNDVDPRKLTGYAKRHAYFTTKISYSMSFPLLDYIIYQGGVHGLWFGVSIIDVGFETFAVLKKIKSTILKKIQINK